MEVENEDVVDNEIETTDVEETETETQEPEAEADKPEGDETPEDPAEEDAPAETEGDKSGEEGEGTSAFKPNTQFKVLDKVQEIPKEFHALMKDEASEKMVKDLFERAHGIDVVKTKLSEVRQSRDTLQSENKNLHGSIQKARTLYQRAASSGEWHRMDDFFHQLNIPLDNVMAWAIEKAKLEQMEPAQRQAVLARHQSDREAFTHSESVEELQAQNFQKDQEIRQIQLDTALATPQVQNFASELDNKFGNKGLFLNEVIAAGQQAWSTQNKVLTVTEAIQAVVTKYALKGQTAPAAAGQGLPAANQPAGTKKVVQRTTTTIPNVGSGGGRSPVGKGGKGPRSVEDIKKLAEKAARGEQI